MSDPIKRIQIPGTLLEAIKTRPEREVSDLFDELAKQTSMEITGCQNTEQLWQHQAKVRGILEMKQFFLSEMRRK